jgi:hypothetical protein
MAARWLSSFGGRPNSAERRSKEWRKAMCSASTAFILSSLHNRTEEPTVLMAVRRTRKGPLASASEPSWTQ